jgi:hypothetical protein
MSAFEDETRNDGILLLFLFIREYVGYSFEAIIAAVQLLTKECLDLAKFGFDVSRFTAHCREPLQEITNAGAAITPQHFILIFSALKEANGDEFKMEFMRLYGYW